MSAVGILEVVGGTPIVELGRLFANYPIRAFAKLESLNPGGSMKDRSALSMLEGAMRRGLITRRTTIVESSSGNMGVGLAQVCAYLGIRFICVVDANTIPSNIALIKAYGAKVEVIPQPTNGQSLLHARLTRVHQHLEDIEDAFWPNQYANADNAGAHLATMHEIIEALDGDCDVLLCPTSTCGTLRGCAEYVRRNGLGTRIIAVDAVGSVIFPGQQAQPRLLPGHGAARRSELWGPDLAERCIHISDIGSVVGCRQLVRFEALLAGASSGAVVSALHKIAPVLAPGSRCALILPDRGERYLETVYSDEWVRDNLGDVHHLWENAENPLELVDGYLEGYRIAS